MDSRSFMFIDCGFELVILPHDLGVAHLQSVERALQGLELTSYSLQLILSDPDHDLISGGALAHLLKRVLDCDPCSHSPLYFKAHPLLDLPHTCEVSLRGCYLPLPGKCLLVALPESNFKLSQLPLKRLHLFLLEYL
jgi:hypothetical protein